MRTIGLVVAVGLAVAACGSSATIPTAGASQVAAPSAATASCQPQVDRGVIPDWARTGFSAAEPTEPHTLGRDGQIVAILFGDPLTFPATPGKNNKILWVARTISSASDLAISAQRMDGATAVGDSLPFSVQGGPGPSVIDLPAVGCWRLALRWADQTDSLDLQVIQPAP